jgi:hypothetical protein
MRRARLAGFFAAFALPAPARAEPEADAKDAARQMARRALELMHEERWTEAESLLARAYRLVPAPTVAVLDGRALEQMGKLVEAAERYEVARTPPPGEAPDAFRDASAEATKRLESVRARTPKLAIAVAGTPRPTDVVLTLDGRALGAAAFLKPEPVNPGEHVIRASRSGRPVVEDHVVLNESESKEVVIRLPPEPERPRASEPPTTPSPNVAPHSPARTWAFVALGVGAVGIGTGVTAGVMMLDAKSSLDTACSPRCPRSSSDDLSRFRTTRTVSAIGYGVGALGVGAGAALLLFAPPPPAREVRAGVTVYATPAGAGVRGNF